MEESHGEDPASHTGPESCGGIVEAIHHGLREGGRGRPISNPCLGCSSIRAGRRTNKQVANVGLGIHLRAIGRQTEDAIWADEEVFRRVIFDPIVGRDCRLQAQPRLWPRDALLLHEFENGFIAGVHVHSDHLVPISKFSFELPMRAGHPGHQSHAVFVPGCPELQYEDLAAKVLDAERLAIHGQDGERRREAAHTHVCPLLLVNFGLLERAILLDLKMRRRGVWHVQKRPPQLSNRVGAECSA